MRTGTDRLKALVKDYSIYGIGEFLNRSAQVLILPLVFLYLSPQEFGVLDYFLSVKNLASVILGFGLFTSVMRFGTSKSLHDPRMVNGTAFSVVLIFNSALFFLSVFVAEDVSFLLLGADFSKEFILAHIISMLFALRTVPIAILRMREEPVKYVVVTMSFFGVYLASTYYMLSVYKLGYMAFFWGNIAGLGVSNVIAGIFTRRDFAFKMNISLSKELLTFGLAILMTSMCLTFIINSNRFFLKGSNDFSEVGLLGMAMRLSLLVGGLLVAPFNLAWLPFVNSVSRDKGFKETIQRVFDGFTIIALVLAVGISSISYDTLTLIGEENYREAAYYVPYFAFAYIFLGYYFIFAAGIYLKNQSRKYVLLSIIVIVANIAPYLAFQDFMSALTVSIITLSSHAVLAACAYYFGNDILGIKPWSSRVLGALVMTILCGLVIAAAGAMIENTVARFAAKAGTILIYTVVLIVSQKRSYWFGTRIVETM